MSDFNQVWDPDIESEDRHAATFIMEAATYVLRPDHDDDTDLSDDFHISVGRALAVMLASQLMGSGLDADRAASLAAIVVASTEPNFIAHASEANVPRTCVVVLFGQRSPVKFITVAKPDSPVVASGALKSLTDRIMEEVGDDGIFLGKEIDGESLSWLTEAADRVAPLFDPSNCPCGQDHSELDDPSSSEIWRV